MISTRLVELVIDTVVCLTLAKWETVSGQFGGYLNTGKFTIDGDKFITKVDISWNELFTGQDQVRFFKLEGDKLTIRTAEQVSAVYPGKRVVGTLTWERER
jgi:hypothetical protein